MKKNQKGKNRKKKKGEKEKRRKGEKEKKEKLNGCARGENEKDGEK